MKHFVVPKAAAVVVCHDPKQLRSWCNEMCSSLWWIEPSEMSVPKHSPEDSYDAHVVYFWRRIDSVMFEQAFKADMWFANQIN